MTSESLCRNEQRTYYATVPNRNDGLLDINYTVQERSYNGPAKGSPNLGDHSFLYNDRERGCRRGGTGFNRAEMVYNERRYNAFNEGDRNPSTEDAED